MSSISSPNVGSYSTGSTPEYARRGQGYGLVDGWRTGSILPDQLGAQLADTAEAAGARVSAPAGGLGAGNATAGTPADDRASWRLLTYVAGVLLLVYALGRALGSSS